MAESERIRKIRSELQARSRQNAVGHVSIIKLPACLRQPVECYTPQQWQFGLHNRNPRASGSESEVLKISLAAACKLNANKWDEFCADFVEIPEDMMLKSYGIYSSVTELSPKEVQYLLTLDALALVLVLTSLSRVPESELDQAQKLPNLFIESLVAGGFNIEPLVKYGVACCAIWDDLLLCENQIPMALIKKAISKCYGLLPEERKSNHYPELPELENPDSDVTKRLLDRILKFAAYSTCCKIFAPCPHNRSDLLKYINDNYEVGKLETCAHIFAVIHKVMTSRVESTATDTEILAPNVNQQPETDRVATTDMELSHSDTELLATNVNQQLETDEEAVPIGADEEASLAVTTTFGRAKQSFLRAVATISKQLATVIATIFGFSRATGPATIFGSRDYT